MKGDDRPHASYYMLQPRRCQLDEGLDKICNMAYTSLCLPGLRDLYIADTSNKFCSPVDIKKGEGMTEALAIGEPENNEISTERYFVQIRYYKGNNKFGAGISKYLDKEDTLPIYKLLMEKRKYSDKYGRVVNKKRIRKLEL